MVDEVRRTFFFFAPYICVVIIPETEQKARESLLFILFIGQFKCAKHTENSGFCATFNFKCDSCYTEDHIYLLINSKNV